MNETQTAKMKLERDTAAIQASLHGVGRMSSITHREKSELETAAVKRATERYAELVDDADRDIVSAAAERDSDLPLAKRAADSMPATNPDETAAKVAAQTKVEARRVELAQMIARGAEKLAHDRFLAEVSE